MAPEWCVYVSFVLRVEGNIIKAGMGEITGFGEGEFGGGMIIL